MSPETQGDATKGFEASLKKMEERMDAQFKLMKAQLQKTTGSIGTTPQRQQFMAAALRLPEGDPLREIALRDYALTTNSSGNDVQQRWIKKANAENFRQWLAGPEGSAPFDFGKIFKSLGYTIDLTQENLPPAVPCMLMALIFAEGEKVEQMQQAAR